MDGGIRVLAASADLNTFDTCRQWARCIIVEINIARRIGFDVIGVVVDRIFID
jgi:hypothetical protein